MEKNTLNDIFRYLNNGNIWQTSWEQYRLFKQTINEITGGKIWLEVVSINCATNAKSIAVKYYGWIN